MQALTTQVLDADVSEAELEVQSSFYGFQIHKDLVGRKDTLDHIITDAKQKITNGALLIWQL